MTKGVGGSAPQQELARMESMTVNIVPIGNEERLARISRAQALMREQGIAALYLDTSVNLSYFTGLNLKATERLHGALIPADGPVVYLSPAFEEPKTRSLLNFGDDIRVWEEHEDPTALVVETAGGLGGSGTTIAVDPATPFFTFDGMRRAGNRFDFTNGASITAACRIVKSPAEIALMQRANEVSLEVHKAAARSSTKGLRRPRSRLSSLKLTGAWAQPRPPARRSSCSAKRRPILTASATRRRSRRVTWCCSISAGSSAPTVLI